MWLELNQRLTDLPQSLLSIFRIYHFTILICRKIFLSCIVKCQQYFFSFAFFETFPYWERSPPWDTGGQAAGWGHLYSCQVTLKTEARRRESQDGIYYTHLSGEETQLPRYYSFSVFIVYYVTNIKLASLHTSFSLKITSIKIF